MFALYRHLSLVFPQKDLKLSNYQVINCQQTYFWAVIYSLSHKMSFVCLHYDVTLVQGASLRMLATGACLVHSNWYARDHHTFFGHLQVFSMVYRCWLSLVFEKVAISSNYVFSNFHLHLYGFIMFYTSRLLLPQTIKSSWLVLIFVIGFLRFNSYDWLVNALKAKGYIVASRIIFFKKEDDLMKTNITVTISDKC